MTNYLIIESEKVVIDKITNVLNDFLEFNFVGHSHEYENSMDIVLKEMPDLVFVNIDSERFSAFDLVKELRNYLRIETEFVAISKSKAKTYNAIKMSFFDYLLTPISDLEIRKTAIKFKKKHLKKINKRICLKSYKDYQYINIDEILFLRADNNTTEFHLNDGVIVNAFKTLKTYESILPSYFLRIHKSYIINVNYVSRVSYNNLQCTIKNNKSYVPFTKTYKHNVEIMINTLSPKESLIGLN